MPRAPNTAPAISAAAGLAARDFFGVRAADSNITKSLGKSGDITRAQHCRAEVYIDGKGWFPVDPADVRKVISVVCCGTEGSNLASSSRESSELGVAASCQELVFGRMEFSSTPRRATV